MQNWLKFTLFGETSAWGIVYRDMYYRKMDIFKKNAKEEDVDLFFKKIQRVGEAINKNPKIRKMYKDIHKLHKETL